MPKENEIISDTPFKNSNPAHYQVIVGTGEQVEILGKSSLAQDYTALSIPLTESTWLYSDTLPHVDIKFIIPANSKVYRVSL